VRPRGGLLGVGPVVDGHRRGDRRERGRGLPLTAPTAPTAPDGDPVAVATDQLDAAARALGDELGVDGPALLRERQELLGIAPLGRRSAGGSCRLVRASDRWLAVNLARPDDRDAVPAWLGREVHEPIWDAVERGVRGTEAAAAVERAQLLGIPAAVAVAPGECAVAAVTVSGERPGGAGGRSGPAGAPRRPPSTVPVVVDLAALWAGPLCSKLLGGALGARVVKVEDLRRPDGARGGPPAFWRSLNAGKEERHLDVTSADGRSELADLVRGAAVVVSAARPRAFAALGLDPAAVAARGGVWVSITGYGLSGPWSDRVAFGDDAAVAGGLAVAAGGEDPVFVGDAVADPLAGLAGAVVARRLAAAGRGGVVDVAMAGVVARALST